MIRKVLHTSDWHIGRKLKEHDRTQEFQKFFDLLLKTIHDENIDALLVSGDIFDNTNPTVQAQELYYSTLHRLVDSHCRHIVIISGNHDSPAFLDAPANLLEHCRIHVVGQARTTLSDEVLSLTDPDGKPELIVCAVPYLRDKDVRLLAPSDNPFDTEHALIDGIKTHYERVFAKALELQEASNIPVIAMGHLFLQGAETKTDDGTRELYIGTAIRVGGDIFPEWLTYTALGHLHSPQKAGGRENIRYSGSPLAMTFGDSARKKAMYILELDGKNLVNIKTIDIPAYQKFKRVKGDLQGIMKQLREISESGESVWVDVTYTGDEMIADMPQRIRDFMIDCHNVDVLSVYDESKRPDRPDTTPLPIDNVSPIDMLNLRLDEEGTPQEQREIFRNMYREILRDLGVDY